MFDRSVHRIANADVSLDTDLEDVETVGYQFVYRLLTNSTISFEIDLVGDNHERYRSGRFGKSETDALLEVIQFGETSLVRDGEDEKTSGRNGGGGFQLGNIAYR